MKPTDDAASRPHVTPSYYESIAAEIERIAEMLRDSPELNHHAAERLLRIARDIRSDVGRVVAAGNENKEGLGS